MDNNPQLWSPGIKLGVQPGSFFHQTECFGPVLGLMRAENLDQAIDWANDSAFGLTGGIHSLDDREIAYWQAHIQVGNAYINRHITGAIVQRQPFGGWKGSVFGPGAKAGGPNYVLQLASWQQLTLPTKQASCAPAVTALLERCLARLPLAHAQELLRASAGSYAWFWQQHFGQEHDPSQVLGEHNALRYRPCRGILLRVEQADPVAVCQALLAAYTVAAPLTVSLSPAAQEWLWLNEEKSLELIVEEEATLVERLNNTELYDRLRLLEPLSPALRGAANQAHLTVIDDPILANGRLELRHYLREQAVAQIMHRYGNMISEE